jgi:hypothetical protein
LAYHADKLRGLEAKAGNADGAIIRHGRTRQTDFSSLTETLACAKRHRRAQSDSGVCRASQGCARRIRHAQSAGRSVGPCSHAPMPLSRRFARAEPRDAILDATGPSVSSTGRPEPCPTEGGFSSARLAEVFVPRRLFAGAQASYSRSPTRNFWCGFSTASLPPKWLSQSAQIDACPPRFALPRPRDDPAASRQGQAA